MAADPADSAFDVQADVRTPWRTYLDALEPLRGELHRYCVRLTGNVWDGEDLVQETLAKVFSLLGKIDANLTNPRGYLVRAATHTWIDHVRRSERERRWIAEATGSAEAQEAVDPVAVNEAAGTLLTRLSPQQRAAVLLKDVLGFSIADTAACLSTTEGAVKSALHRGRDQLSETEVEVRIKPPRELVAAFEAALAAADIDALRALCLADVTVDMVGGAQMNGFEEVKPFFEHAHMVWPELGFGENPNWRVADYGGEAVVLGFRTLDGQEGLNEIHRLDVDDGKVARIRCYCFCPDSLRWVGEQLGLPVLQRRYRSPS